MYNENGICGALGSPDQGFSVETDMTQAQSEEDIPVMYDGVVRVREHHHCIYCIVLGMIGIGGKPG